MLSFIVSEGGFYSLTGGVGGLVGWVGPGGVALYKSCGFACVRGCGGQGTYERGVSIALIGTRRLCCGEWTFRCLSILWLDER